MDFLVKTNTTMSTTQFDRTNASKEYFSNDHYLAFTQNCVLDFYVLLAAHLSIILDNDQLDTHLLYFTIRLL